MDNFLTRNTAYQKSEELNENWVDPWTKKKNAETKKRIINYTVKMAVSYTASTVFLFASGTMHFATGWCFNQLGSPYSDGIFVMLGSLTAIGAIGYTVLFVQFFNYSLYFTRKRIEEKSKLVILPAISRQMNGVCLLYRF